MPVKPQSTTVKLQQLNIKVCKRANHVNCCHRARYKADAIYDESKLAKTNCDSRYNFRNAEIKSIKLTACIVLMSRINAGKTYLSIQRKLTFSDGHNFTGLP